jgi:hypothetical protein
VGRSREQISGIFETDVPETGQLQPLTGMDPALYMVRGISHGHHLKLQLQQRTITS